MYQSAKGNIQAGLRFRRWTRRSYAVFSSLGREVTIGRLSVSMVPLAMMKLRNAVCEFNFDSFSDDESREEEISVENIGLVPCLITNTAGKASDINPFIKRILTRTVGMVL